MTVSQSNFRLLQIQDFFAKNATPGAERAVQQSVETILSTATWLERDADGVKAWLDARYA